MSMAIALGTIGDLVGTLGMALEHKTELERENGKLKEETQIVEAKLAAVRQQKGLLLDLTIYRVSQAIQRQGDPVRREFVTQAFGFEGIVATLIPRDQLPSSPPGEDIWPFSLDLSPGFRRNTLRHRTEVFTKWHSYEDLPRYFLTK